MRVFATVGLLYVTLILLVFPGWIEIAGHASLLYAAYAAPGYLTAPTRSVLYVGLPVLVLLVAASHIPLRASRPELARWGDALAIVAAVGLVVFVAQKRGWLYHALPTLLMLGVGYGLCVARVAWRVERRPLRLAASALLAGLALALGVVAPQPTRPLVSRADLASWELVEQLRTLGDPPVALLLSTSLEPGFPIVTELDLAWGSRFPCLWTLAGLRHREQLQQQGGADAAGTSAVTLHELEDATARMLAADLDRYTPSVVAVDERPERQAIDADFDILARLRAHRSFEEAWRPYVRVAKADGFEIYRRQANR